VTLATSNDAPRVEPTTPSVSAALMSGAGLLNSALGGPELGARAISLPSPYIRRFGARARALKGRSHVTKSNFGAPRDEPDAGLG